MKNGAGAVSVETVLGEIAKLQQLRALGLPEALFRGTPARLVTHYRQRAASEPPRELRRHQPNVRHTLTVPLDGVVADDWQELVQDDERGAINRISYEWCVLTTLREKLRCKEVWVKGARRFRNPDEDLPQDFDARRTDYYAALKQPQDARVFVEALRHRMEQALAHLAASLPTNDKVKLVTTKKGKGRICVTPLDEQPEGPNIVALTAALVQRWPMTNLLDILKETELRVRLAECFRSVGAREVLPANVLQRRMLLCLYGLGTNAGLKRMCSGGGEDGYLDLQYVRRRYITKEQLRAAIAQVCNAIFHVRNPALWGKGTTACASDSKQFGAWDQNLITEWHARYGGRGVMIYWHVEKNSVCIYSQLKSPSSSEVSAMIEGVLRHDTEMDVQKQYVDTHGQSEVGFAFCKPAGFLPSAPAEKSEETAAVPASEGRAR